MQEAEIRDRVKQELSPKRFRHTEGVVRTAEQLAVRYGEDADKARIAAWLHDIAREWPPERLLQFAETVEIPAGFATIPELLHGPIGAALAKAWFDIDDADVCNAIRFHTSGRLGMSKLEQIVYLADAIEPSRHYPGVETIRAIAANDLLLALAQSFDATLSYLLATHASIFPLTVMARNELWEALQVQPRNSEV